MTSSLDDRSKDQKPSQFFDQPPTTAERPPDETQFDNAPSAPAKTFRFWVIFLALALLGLSSSLEATITTTALPTIAQSIDLGGQYVWVGSAFLLASAVVQPFIGQLADVFGRRWPLIIVTALFVLGSGICGGANNAGMLIAGRTVQGLGAGGILVLIDVVVCDLVALQERAKFLGLVRITGAIGSSIGPIVGGAIARADWRWCFYLNLITGGLALLYLILFLRIANPSQEALKPALMRIDYFGALLFMASTTSLLLGLIMGDVIFPWRAANIIVPIVLGVVAWLCFPFYEHFAKYPMVPNRIFGTRTSAAGFFMAFDGALLLYWVIWFLPIYFQGVLGASPLRSGVNQLPLNIIMVPAGIIAGGMLSKSGKYKMLQFVGFGLSSIGVGLFTILDENSHKAAWVCFQLIESLGLGIILTTVLPAIQASRVESDMARVTAMYAFMRSFGGIWGVTIPSIIFNSQVNNKLARISDSTVRQALANGDAYGFAAFGSIQRLDSALRSEVLSVYDESLTMVWNVAIGFALAGFVSVLAIKQYDMSRKDQSGHAIETKKDEPVQTEKGDAVAGEI